MKTSETKTTASIQRKNDNKAQQPFFQKQGEGPSFFSDTQQDSSQPFFSPSTIQPKLKIGSPNDKYEREADAVADKVVNQVGSSGTIQTKCSSCEQEEQIQKMEQEEIQEKKDSRLMRKAIFESNDDSSTLQAKTDATASSSTASSDLQNRLNRTKGSGQALSEATQTSMGSAMNANFSKVRVHTGSEAVQMNQELGARAFTHGSDVYFNRGEYNEGSRDGQRLLAHELVHTVQQGDSNSSIKQRNNKFIQKHGVLDTPDRFNVVHNNLFSTTGTSTQPRQPWVEPQSSNQIVQEFKQNFPRSPRRRIPQRTTENQAEADALVANQRIRNTFNDITIPVSESRLRAATKIMDNSFFQDDNFRRQWLANQMFKHTSIRTFNINESDTNFRNLQDRLFQDTEIGDDIENSMRLISAFARGDNPSNREIFLNQGISASQRKLTLIHEIIHFYAHAQYRDWIAQSPAERIYNEGLTEHFARQVMTSDEKTNRTSYQNRVTTVRNEILAFASESDVRKAFFKGEVWRLEHTSNEAQEAFGNQIGIQSNASRTEEKTQSITSPGIIQTVEDNRHFRFMNLGIEQSNPKPEHQAFLRSLFTEIILPNPNLRIRFVGHTSTTGSIRYNRNLSRRRVNAFYQLARDIGIPNIQLINVNNPESEGELNITANDNTVIGRAINRRVELYIIPPNSTALEDNIFHLERLRGQGVEDGENITLGNDLTHLIKNSPNPDSLLPFTTNGWNAQEIMTQLGQHDIIKGTDSDSIRCVQAVAMASYIPNGPDAVIHYLDTMPREASRTRRRMTQRRQKAVEVITFVTEKIQNRTATFGDLSWAQEAVHDLFFDDVSGTDSSEIRNQISSTLDNTRTFQALDLWANSSSELITIAQSIQPGEQLLVNHWKILFDESFEQLRDRNILITNPMEIINDNGRRVSIVELNPTSRPIHTEIDENRDKKSGHQFFIFKDNLRRIWFYEPEVTETGQHLFEITNNATLLNPYFTETPEIELFEYIQITGKITSNNSSANAPSLNNSN